MLDPSFQPFVSGWTLLDQYCMPTRYPDALADPAVPFESYSVDRAAEAIRVASDIVNAVQPKL